MCNVNDVNVSSDEDVFVVKGRVDYKKILYPAERQIVVIVLISCIWFGMC